MHYRISLWREESQRLWQLSVERLWICSLASSIRLWINSSSNVGKFFKSGIDFRLRLCQGVLESVDLRQELIVVMLQCLIADGILTVVSSLLSFVMSYTEQPIAIMDRSVKTLKN